MPKLSFFILSKNEFAIDCNGGNCRCATFEDHLEMVFMASFGRYV